MAKRKPRKKGGAAKAGAKKEAKAPEELDDSDDEPTGAGYCSDSDQGDFTESDDEGEDGYRKGGYHPVQLNEIYNRRYRVLGKLGWGHFSTVWLCEDLKRTEDSPVYVAMKVQKSATHYTEAACDEIELLTLAAQKKNAEEWAAKKVPAEITDDPSKWIPKYTGVVQLLDYFEHHGPHGKHVCMVFETMGPNILALIKKYNFKGVPIDVVRKVTLHTLIGLDYLHRVCGIIHTDLKPENVLVTCPLGVPVDKKGQPIVPTLNPTRGAAVAPGLSPPKKNSPKEAKDMSPETAKVQAKKDKKREKKKRQRNKKKAEAKGDADKDTANEKEEDAAEEAAPTKKYPDPPYMKPMLKPSRSDPTLLNSFGDLVTCWKPPYHHFMPHAVGAPPAGRDPPQAGPRADVEYSAECQQVMDMDIFDYERVVFKVVDLGNACWVDRHFSEDIQTRQYRSPEVIIGAPYHTSADIWSLACMTFELATGDYLFDPKAAEEYSRDEDHLALYIELLGRIPKKLIDRGKHSKQYFTRQGELKHIKSLRFWGLDDVLKKKYKMNPVAARNFASFLMPMLALDPDKRASAEELLQHPWLRGEPGTDMSDLFSPSDGRMPNIGSEDSDEGSALEDAEAFSSDYENEDGVKVQNGEYMDMAMLSEAYRLGVLNPDDQNVQAMLMSLTARVEAEDDDLASSNEDGSGPVDDDVAQEEVKVEELEGGDCSDVETKVKEEESPSPEKDKDPDSPATVDVD
jgi:serine/threonine-protein kinase SRPK3